MFPCLNLRRPGSLLLLAAVFGFVACVRAEAPGPGSSRVIYVAPDGDDAASGTERDPLGTIAAAAEVARAGDTVRIAAGVYAERVRVAGEGSRDRPIVFEAEVPGTVVITGADGGFAPLHWAGDHDGLAASGNRWVTLRGLSFRGISNRPAVRAATGWRIERCLFEEVASGINVRGHEVTVTESIFQDINSPTAHAIVVYGSRNPRLTDLVIRRVNSQRLIESISNSAVIKILKTDHLLVEGMVSQDNVGPGLWLDFDNTNFVIRRNYLSGNRGDDHDWEGPGLWVELNPSANGRIYENVITDNSGAGIEIMESSDIAVYDNILLGNGSCIALRNLDRGGEGVRDIRIHDNLCGAWQDVGIKTGIGEWTDWDAASRGVVIDHNRYLTPPGAPIFHWLGEEAMTLPEARASFGLEANGVALSAGAAPGEDRP